MTTTPIFLLAPGPGMTFVAMPSGATYVSDANGLVQITNGSVADELALIAGGCAVLAPNSGGNVTTQAGTSYSLQNSDQNTGVLFTASSATAVTLPNDMPVGFAVTLYQTGTGQVGAIAAGGGT